MLIIASIGINSLTEDRIRKIILAGADILRYNFAYRSLDENLTNLQVGREAIDSLNSSGKTMVDLPTKKIRLGDFDIKAFSVQENEELLFRSASYSPDCKQFIPVQISKLGTMVKLNQTITLGDGEVAMHVIEIIDQDTTKIKMLNNGVINFKKSFNIDLCLDENLLLEQYKEIIEKTEPLKPDYIAFSFINENFCEKVKQLFDKYESKPKLVAKIEQKLTPSEINYLCSDISYNIILIDRGELGVNLPYQQLGILQKEISTIAKEKKKKIVVSTQILDSVINNYTPNRSEILDLTNIVLDGADGIMLCHETAFGARPAYPISVAKKIINEVEMSKEFFTQLKKRAEKAALNSKA